MATYDYTQLPAKVTITNNRKAKNIVDGLSPEGRDVVTAIKIPFFGINDFKLLENGDEMVVIAPTSPSVFYYEQLSKKIDGIAVEIEPSVSALSEEETEG